MGAAEPARLSERALRLGSSRCASRAVRTARRGNDLLRAMLRATSCPLASHHERTRWTTNAARVSSATPRDQTRGAPAALLRPRLSLVACFSFVVCVCDPHTRSARSKRRPLLPTARSPARPWSDLIVLSVADSTGKHAVPCVLFAIPFCFVCSG